MDILFFILLVVLFVGGFLASKEEADWEQRYARKRQKELRQYAHSRGWHFSEEDQWFVLKTLEKSHLFQWGHSKKAHNFICGNTQVKGHSLDFRFFDYTFTTGGGESKASHHYTVCLFEVPYLFKSLSLWPESYQSYIFNSFSLRPVSGGIRDKITNAMTGFEEIHFESEEFNNQFYTKSSDKKFAYDIISTTMMEFLLDSFKEDALEMGGCFFYLYRSCQSEPRELDRYLALGKRFFDEIPEFAKKNMEPLWKVLSNRREAKASISSKDLPRKDGKKI